MSLRESRIDSALVYDGGLLKVRRDSVKLPDGNLAFREYIRHPGASVIIAINPHGNLLMVRQFRYPLDRTFLELPAGKIDPGETPLECARRELREETGYEASDFREIATVHPCIGYSDERLVYFIAENLSHAGKQTDEEEFLENVEISLGDALEMVRCGEISDGKTVSGLFWAERILSGSW